MTPRISLIAVALCLQSCPLSIAQAETGFVPLFDGQTLDGWVNVNGGPDTWSAREGVIHCTGTPLCELRTERMYQNFILKVQWRHLRPKGNAGIFVWCDAITVPGEPFNRGIEVQVLDGHGHLGLTGAATTGNIIADLIAERPTDFDISPFRAERF